MTIFLSNNIKGAKDEGAIGFDAVMEWSVEESARVSSHPVEEGSDVSDNYSEEPVKVSFSGVITPWDFTGKGVQENPEEFIRKLQKAKKDSSPFDIFLSDDLQPITSCLITRFNYQRTAKEGKSILVDIEAQQVKITSSAEETSIDDLALSDDVKEQGQGGVDGGDGTPQKLTYFGSTINSGVKVVTFGTGSIAD